MAIHPSLVDPMTYGQVEGCFSTAPWLFFEVTKAMSKISVWDAEGKEATAFKNFQQSLWGHFSMAKPSIEYTNWISPIQVRREVTSEKHAFGRHFVFLHDNALPTISTRATRNQALVKHHHQVSLKKAFITLVVFADTLQVLILCIYVDGIRISLVSGGF